MKFRDFKSFRDYDRKIVKITNVNEDLKKGLKITELAEPIYGILYIDRQCGASLRITGNDNIEYKDIMLIVRSGQFNDMNFEIVDGNDFTKKILDQINEGYYDDNFNELLYDKRLDKYRHEDFPNDVEAILPSDEQPEKMWVRLFMKTKEENLYVAELLDDSFFNKLYTAGKKVAIVLYKKEDFEGLIINGLVKMADE